MPYVTLAQIKAALPDDLTAQLLDDTASGAADAGVWAAILEAVTREIDGKVGQRYTLPFPDPQPALLGDAAFVLAAELCYQRKGFYDDANPWTKRAKGVRADLSAIAAGETPLTPTAKRTNAPATAIVAPAKTFPSGGHMLA